MINDNQVCNSSQSQIFTHQSTSKKEEKKHKKEYLNEKFLKTFQNQKNNNKNLNQGDSKHNESISNTEQNENPKIRLKDLPQIGKNEEEKIDDQKIKKERTDKNIENDIIVSIKVEIDENHNEDLNITQNDDPMKIALMLCKKHNLPNRIIKRLGETIIKKINQAKAFNCFNLSNKKVSHVSKKYPQYLSPSSLRHQSRTLSNTFENTQKYINQFLINPLTNENFPRKINKSNLKSKAEQNIQHKIKSYFD